MKKKETTVPRQPGFTQAHGVVPDVVLKASELSQWPNIAELFGATINSHPQLRAFSDAFRFSERFYRISRRITAQQTKLQDFFVLDFGEVDGEASIVIVDPDNRHVQVRDTPAIFSRIFHPHRREATA